MKNVDNFGIIIWSDAVLACKFIFFVGCCPVQILMRHWWFGGSHAYFEYNKGSGVVLHAHTQHMCIGYNGVHINTMCNVWWCVPVIS